MTNFKDHVFECSVQMDVNICQFSVVGYAKQASKIQPEDANDKSIVVLYAGGLWCSGCAAWEAGRVGH